MGARLDPSQCGQAADGVRHQRQPGRGPMPGLRPLFFAAGLLAFPGASAQQIKPVGVRALKPGLSKEVISFIARNSRPFQASGALGTSTGLQVVERLCGSFYSAYWAEVLEQNKGIDLQLDNPVADPAVTWPRCLFVERFPKRKQIKLERGDRPAVLFERFTGISGKEAQAGWRGFFNVASPAEPEAGQTLGVPYQTLPASLNPLGMARQQFWDELKKVAADSANVDAIAIYDPPDGTIVVSEPDYGDEQQKCAPYAGPVLDAVAIRQAYDFTFEVVKGKTQERG